MSGSRLSTPGLLTRHFLSSVTGSLLVALLIAAAVFVVALAPRALAQVATSELRHDLTSASPALVDLTGSGRIGILEDQPHPTVDVLIGETDETINGLGASLPHPLADHVTGVDWVARTDKNKGKLPTDEPFDLALALALDLEWESRIRFVDGVAPAVWQGSEDDDLLPAERPPIEIALPAESAEKLKLQVGDRVGYVPAAVVVSGIYEPIDPDDPYWVLQNDLLTPAVDSPPGERTVLRASAYIDPESMIGLQATLSFGVLSAWISIDPSGFDYADAGELQGEARRFSSEQQNLPNGGELNFRSGLVNAIDKVVERVTTTTTLLALSVSGMIGVLLAVFTLGVQSVIARRRPALALAAARGAGPLDLRGAMLLEGLLLSLPGSALAIGVAALVIPVKVETSAWVLPVVIALAPPILFAVLTSPRELRSIRGDVQVRARSRVRGTAELAIVGLAAVALFLLARRGLVASSDAVGVDPLLAATPLLLAAAVCVGVLRLFPVPLLALQRRLRSRRGAVGVLGAARAVRAPALGFTAALALIVGIAVVVFSVAMASTITAGLAEAAHQKVGADVRVSALRLDPFVVHEIESVDGVDAVAAIGVADQADFQSASDDTTVSVAFADTRGLHEIRPDIPVLDARVGDRIPLLISSDWSSLVDTDEVTVAAAPALVVGDIPSDSLPGLSRHWVLVDTAFAGDLGLVSEPRNALASVERGASTAAVAAAIRDAVVPTQPARSQAAVAVMDAETALAETRASPIVSSITTALLLAALLSLLLTMLTVALSSVAAATARNRIIGVLRILGMSPRQLRVLQAWELGPVAIVALVVGTALGFALTLIVTYALDLRPFVGGRSAPPLTVDPLWITAAIGAFSVVVVLAGIVAAALGRRFAPAGTLKMGEG
ncbi:hypothetical protein BH11ACT3_BH11ACT3_15330 [soil metagenome]